MQAPAHAIARDDDVGRRPGTIARRARRSVDADDGRAERGRDVRRPGVAGDHQRRAAGERDEIGDRRARRQDRRSVRRRHDRVGNRLFARSPRHHRSEPVPIAQRRSHRAEARRGPPLVRPRRAGVEHGVAAARPIRHLPRDRRVDALEREFRRDRGQPERLEQPEIDPDDVPGLARVVDAVAAGIERIRVERPRQPFTKIG